MYSIKDSQKLDYFVFSALKKTVDESSLFSIASARPEQIINYPEMKAINVKSKIVGMSIGKYHMLAWDTNGKLYSWGLRTLALGN